jgi:hypothetical protein
MKKIFITMVGMAAILFSGCSDFLTENNKSNAAAGDYYSTDAGFESLVNACYSTLRDVYGSNTEVFNAGTDLFMVGRGGLTSQGLGNYINLTPADNSVKNFYTNVYVAIKRCNDAVHYSTGHSAIRLAEVRFLRAFYYFQLIQQFGDVALVTDFLESPITNYPRTAAKDIYSFIISEMEAVLPTLPATAAGRVNQRVVNHYLALVYLTRGYDSNAGGSSADFTKAITYATAAINNQALTLDFEKDLFWPGKEQNAEIIFSVQYSAASLASATTGNSQASYYGAYLGGSDGATGDGMPYMNTALKPTMRLYNLLCADRNDKRFGGTFMQTVYGTGTGTSAKCSFYSYFKTTPATTNVILYYPRPNDVQADVDTWKAASPATRNNATIVWSVNGTTTWQNNNLDRAFPCIKKFSDPDSPFNTTSSRRDIFLARVAETYLIRAEAEIKADGEGVSTRAASDINVVRTRAGAASITATSATISYILDERARELAGEYNRWNDLKRTGKLTELVPLYNPDVPDVSYMKGKDNQYKILRPIPQDAINLNSAIITQNPGY